MKKLFQNGYIALIITVLIISVFIIDCKKDDNPVKYPYGIFPDTVVNLQGLNSAFDDYNSTAYQLSGALSLIFSSNRKSSGGQFDLEQGLITFNFNQTNGAFDLNTGMTQDAYLSKLIETAVTPGNDFGPYRLYSSIDGLEYLILSSENIDGNLDLTYCKNVPQYGSNIPVIDGPYPVKLLNTDFDDAYLTFDLHQDSAYFTSNVDGNFDIYVKTRPAGKDISTWFDSDYDVSSAVTSINSSSDDKCPMVYNKFMVFTSDRPGGYGGFDLYYSFFNNGEWSAPVNFGPKINTESDEYRPLIGYHSSFSNIFMIFSSNRTGGNGGFDLYFTGIDIPKLN
jgi:hypothetical protein